MGYIDHDIVCSACGYNLRGLLPDGKCPECGTPIAESVTPRPPVVPPAYRLVRLGILVSSIGAGTLGILSCVFKPRISNITPSTVFWSYAAEVAAATCLLTAILALSALILRRYARRDRIIWFCLLLDVVASLLFHDVAVRIP